MTYRAQICKFAKGNVLSRFKLYFFEKYAFRAFKRTNFQHLWTKTRWDSQIQNFVIFTQKCSYFTWNCAWFLLPQKAIWGCKNAKLWFFLISTTEVNIYRNCTGKSALESPDAIFFEKKTYISQKSIFSNLWYILCSVQCINLQNLQIFA